MTRHDLTHAGLCLFVGCFVISVGLFASYNTAFSLMFLSLGAMNLSSAGLNALPEGPSRAGTAVRAAGFLLSVSSVCLAVAALMSLVP